MRAIACLSVALLALLPIPRALAQSAGEIEIVVVTGRHPGPPLWRVSNGENDLYIFATLSPVPDDMIWDSTRVEAVLAESSEALLAPDIEADFSITMMLNPINLIRGARLMRRLRNNPDGATLQDVLPPALLDRYETLKSLYELTDDDLDELRPFFAGSQLAEQVRRKAGLVPGDGVTRKVERLIRRGRDLERTDIEVTMDLTGSFRDLAERAEALVESLSREQELECFAAQLHRVETDLDAMKRRANAWAEGYVDEFRGIPLPGDENDECALLLVDSSEFETIEQLREELDARWLAAAEQALATNRSTFAMLEIVELLRDDGLLTALAMRGYKIWEP